MELLNLLKFMLAAAIILVVLDVGWYVAGMVKQNPGEMECFIGIGPKHNPTLCYGWSQTRHSPSESTTPSTLTTTPPQSTTTTPPAVSSTIPSTTQSTTHPAAPSTTHSTVSSTTTAFPELNINVGTDKTVYHSKQEMTVSVSVESPQNLGPAVLHVHGINSRFERLDVKKDVEVKAGSNSYTVSYTTPNCTGCAGISPGKYSVTADVLAGQQTLGSASTEVEIQQ